MENRFELTTDIIGKEGAACFWVVGFCSSSRIVPYLRVFFAYCSLLLREAAAPDGRSAQREAFYLAKKLEFARLKPSSLACIKPDESNTVYRCLMNGVRKAPLPLFPVLATGDERLYRAIINFFAIWKHRCRGLDVPALWVYFFMQKSVHLTHFYAAALGADAPRAADCLLSSANGRQAVSAGSIRAPC